MKSATNQENKDKIKTTKKIILIGNANVGKSVIFGLLTGQYVVVSNYPGTTVEIATGKLKMWDREYELIDTPGVSNLLPMSSDEVVTRDILLETGDYFVVQVADAKNPARTLLLSIQLAEMKIPFILVLNMADEARERRIDIDLKKLSAILGIPVVSTIAVTREGIGDLKKALESPQESIFEFTYDEFIENALEELTPMLPDLNISRRSLGLMLLAGDATILKHIQEKIDSANHEKINGILRDVQDRYPDPLSFIINRERLTAANAVVEKTSSIESIPRKGFAHKMGNLCMHNIWGIPILIAVLYIMYMFVGVFAAGTIVDYISSTLFGEFFVPWLDSVLKAFIPWSIVREALSGEYGLLSTGLNYALAIVLPIVAAFFFFFSFLEDSGYLPRLAIIANKACNVMGLNGKAVLPMVLGLGCGTMAALSARILDSKKEQLMVILLISLGVPCSAQLGVIMGMLAGMSPFAFVIWLFVIIGSMILVGWAANRVLPGESADFILEIPPLRVPSLKNIAIKTLARMWWYLKEAVPLFLIATFALFLLDKTGALKFLENLTSPVIVSFLGLPEETTKTFLMGFLRRDYGAAGLLDMAKAGILSNNQLLVAMVTITLFLPCVAQFFVIIKEQGLKKALMVSAFIFFYSVLLGGIINYLIKFSGMVF